jgi:serine/threonine protein phosphatase 1
MAFSTIRLKFRTSPPAPAVPDGARVYAVGDVHGRDDLLDQIAAAIEGDLATAPATVVTVFLGDYVDRGPHSADVVERLASGRFPTPIRTLRGNHEHTMLRFLDKPEELDQWRNFGGLETLHSYGVDVSRAMRGEGYDEAREALAAALPSAHRRFLEETELCATYGDYFFCHAGVRPGVPLDRQSAEDLMWIRDDFLRSGRSFGKVVVHGHTPVAAPEWTANRINIDTGAFATSLLTCLALEGVERRFLTTVKR